jgi:GT2 family glycosyltransferase
MIDISIIIISYNTREMTLGCLRSVLDQTEDISFETIVVDNNSSDTSSQAIEEEFPGILLIKSPKNLGFAQANNLAAERAKGRYLLLLNPDTVVKEGAIQKLHLFARKHPANRIYGGRTLYGDGTLNPTSCWRQPTLWSLFCYATGLVSLFRRHPLFDPESYGRWQRDKVRRVDIVTGCFLLIEKEIWDHLGGFDSKFFMYGEDADLCLRAARLGARPIITPEATIIHYCGASEKIRADKMVRLFKAKEQLIRSHWRPTTACLGLALLRASVVCRVLACRILDMLSPKGKRAENAKSWREIWQRRKEWQTTLK